MAAWLRTSHPSPPLYDYETNKLNFQSQKGRIHSLSGNHHRRLHLAVNFRNRRCRTRIYCNSDDSVKKQQPESTGIQLYSEIERLLTETVKQSQDAWGGSSEWREVEGAWVLKPRSSKPKSVVHFVGGIFVGAAPQLTYRLFLERLSEKGVLVIATPYASGFDHFFIADEVQFKFDRCYRFLQETIQDLPTFGIGHSLGSVIHLLIGSRYAVQRSGNVLMAFNNKEASLAIPLFSPVLVPMAQSIGPLLSQIASSPTIRLGICHCIISGSMGSQARSSKPKSVVHFVGGIFVGAAPQLTYCLFLERLSEKGILVIATPYASGFDHFFADEVQFKFDRCYRFLQETIQDLPTFGIGHSLGSVIHLLIGSRYAVQRSGNVLMAFNNKVFDL
ncbi:hypothetical protein FH972_012833 [Carpinus fangiana]|uniref:Uncharacterized protein n=1 Tax=Carpinus fangiana TaxID=176857 RepID=A0A5N6R4W8_9ROSI|nr:hypothetical protein FH972_012833 [Carpinus fangiana]